MVRALIAGRKTQTRRLIKPQPLSLPAANAPDSHVSDDVRVRYAVGDYLWVKETYVAGCPGVRYAATDDIRELRKLKPSLFMPRVLSRLTLEVDQVRVERLQSISEEDAIAEGVVCATGSRAAAFFVPGCSGTISGATARECYARLWDKIQARAGTRWDDNPWIIAVSFRVHPINIDALFSE